ncbi:MAG: UbiX family flavin prenyltransferase [Gemmiger sp.]
MAERLVVGVSGASGAPLAVALLRRLRAQFPGVESHLVMSRGAALTLRQECGLTPAGLAALADVTHDNDSLGAAIASGSFRTMGMAVIPCSMKTVAGIACGYSDNLLLRAADVCLKERRRLVLVAREAPLSTLHLRNLCTVSELGAVVLPPVPAYYRHPQTVADCTDYTVSRVLAQFGLEAEDYQWEGMP